MKKITSLLAAIAAIAGFAALPAHAQQTASSYSVTTDFSYTSQYVFRGLQRLPRGDAFTPSIEGTLGNATRNGYLGLWTMQPITRNQNNEINFYAGYKQKITRAISAEAVATCYWYPEAQSVDRWGKYSYELGAKFTYASRGITASAYGYYDLRLQAMTGVGLIGYSFPIAKFGTSIDVGFYVGTVGIRNWSPDFPGNAPKVRESYVYYGFDLSMPYHISERAIVAVGLHYATNQNTPAGTAANKVWFTLGLTTRF